MGPRVSSFWLLSWASTDHGHSSLQQRSKCLKKRRLDSALSRPLHSQEQLQVVNCILDRPTSIQPAQSTSGVWTNDCKPSSPATRIEPTGIKPSTRHDRWIAFPDEIQARIFCESGRLFFHGLLTCKRLQQCVLRHASRLPASTRRLTRPGTFNSPARKALRRRRHVRVTGTVARQVHWHHTQQADACSGPGPTTLLRLLASHDTHQKTRQSKVEQVRSCR